LLGAARIGLYYAVGHFVLLFACLLGRDALGEVGMRDCALVELIVANLVVNSLQTTFVLHLALGLADFLFTLPMLDQTLPPGGCPLALMQLVTAFYHSWFFTIVNFAYTFLETFYAPFTLRIIFIAFLYLISTLLISLNICFHAYLKFVATGIVWLGLMPARTEVVSAPSELSHWDFAHALPHLVPARLSSVDPRAMMVSPMTGLHLHHGLWVLLDATVELVVA